MWAPEQGQARIPERPFWNIPEKITEYFRGEYGPGPDQSKWNMLKEKSKGIVEWLEQCIYGERSHFWGDTDVRCYWDVIQKNPLKYQNFI